MFTLQLIHKIIQTITVRRHDKLPQCTCFRGL